MKKAFEQLKSLTLSVNTAEKIKTIIEDSSNNLKQCYQNGEAIDIPLLQEYLLVVDYFVMELKNYFEDAEMNMLHSCVDKMYKILVCIIVQQCDYHPDCVNAILKMRNGKRTWKGFDFKANESAIRELVNKGNRSNKVEILNVLDNIANEFIGDDEYANAIPVLHLAIEIANEDNPEIHQRISRLKIFYGTLAMAYLECGNEEKYEELKKLEGSDYL